MDTGNSPKFIRLGYSLLHLAFYSLIIRLIIPHNVGLVDTFRNSQKILLKLKNQT